MSDRERDRKGNWVDPDDAPEWTDEMFEQAEYSIGGKVIRPATGVLTKDGMKPVSEKRQPVTLRLAPEVIAHFKAGGEGWQARIGDVLERHVDKAKRKPA
jgi:uncharacterized protein (DUF4415 family)